MPRYNPALIVERSKLVRPHTFGKPKLTLNFFVAESSTKNVQTDPVVWTNKNNTSKN